jgi:Rad3-related DNA helicase
MTSGTIGNVTTLARELGIRDGTYDVRDVRSQYSPDEMPVYTFDDAPALNHKTSDAGWTKWGDVVWRGIISQDKNWGGLVHVSSKGQAERLAGHLSRRGLGERVYVAEGLGTGDKMLKWEIRKKQKPNTVTIAYSFHMGLDAPDVNINIVAKVPFKTLDDCGMAELAYDSDMYRWHAAMLTEQACGRIRRGNPEHYEKAGESAAKFVAIADNSYNRIKDQFSGHFTECLRPY